MNESAITFDKMLDELGEIILSSDLHLLELNKTEDVNRWICASNAYSFVTVSVNTTAPTGS